MFNNSLFQKTYEYAEKRFYDAYKKYEANNSLGEIHAMFLERRIKKIARWLVDDDLFHHIIHIQAERSLSMKMSFPNIFLKGRVDLILHKNDEISLWDYKTGARVQPASKSHQIKFLAFLYEAIDQKKISKIGIILGNIFLRFFIFSPLCWMIKMDTSFF